MEVDPQYKGPAETKFLYFRRKENVLKDIKRDSIRTAILIDGAFYRRQAYAAFGDVSPKERASELETYCKRHLIERVNKVKYNHELYRIFYYDCLPISKHVYHPLLKRSINLQESDTYSWSLEFFAELNKKENLQLDMVSYQKILRIIL